MIEKEQQIILLSDFIETKVRKEKELEYYQKQLEELQKKMFFLKKEIDLTNLIIDMVDSEKIIDIREKLLEKKQQNLLGSQYDENETET